MVTVAYVGFGADAGDDDAIAVIFVVDLLVLWLTCWCSAVLMRSRRAAKAPVRPVAPVAGITRPRPGLRCRAGA